MQAEHERLRERHRLFATCADAVAMWKTLGIKEPEAIRDMDTKSFAALANSIKGANHDAR